MNASERKLLEELMGDDLAVRVSKELGIDGASLDDKMDVIISLGENIQDRVLLEILKALPQNEIDTFYDLFKNGDPDSVRAFLLKYIPDFDRFVLHHATLEYEATKTDAYKLAQGL